MAKHTASRSEQAVSNRVSRANRASVAEMADRTIYARRRCTKEKPCLGLYAIDTGELKERVLDTSRDPLASVEIHDQELAHQHVLEFTEAFYTLLDGIVPTGDFHKLIPFLPAGMRLLADREPLALGWLRERYTQQRSIRALVERYGMHHETIDRQITRAMYALRECVIEAQREDVAC